METDWELERTEETQKDWTVKIREAVGQREERQWRERMADKPKLKSYHTIKTKLRMEDYPEIADTQKNRD